METPSTTRKTSHGDDDDQKNSISFSCLFLFDNVDDLANACRASAIIVDANENTNNDHDDHHHHSKKNTGHSSHNLLVVDPHTPVYGND